MQIFKLKRKIGKYVAGTLAVRAPNIEPGYKGTLTVLMVSFFECTGAPVQEHLPMSRLKLIAQTPDQL